MSEVKSNSLKKCEMCDEKDKKIKALLFESRLKDLEIEQLQSRLEGYLDIIRELAPAKTYLEINEARQTREIDQLKEKLHLCRCDFNNSDN